MVSYFYHTLIRMFSFPLLKQFYQLLIMPSSTLCTAFQSHVILCGLHHSIPGCLSSDLPFLSCTDSDTLLVCIVSSSVNLTLWNTMDCSQQASLSREFSRQKYYQFSSFQSLSHVRLFATPWIAACQASLSITNSRSSFKLTSIESVMPSSHLILCRPLLLLPPVPLRIRVFSNESTLLMRWPKYWSHYFMANRWGKNGNSGWLYFLGLQKSLQMVTAAMKLKDACSLEGKLWPT